MKARFIPYVFQEGKTWKIRKLSNCWISENWGCEKKGLNDKILPWNFVIHDIGSKWCSRHSRNHSHTTYSGSTRCILEKTTVQGHFESQNFEFLPRQKYARFSLIWPIAKLQTESHFLVITRYLGFLLDKSIQIKSLFNVKF